MQKIIFESVLFYFNVLGFRAVKLCKYMNVYNKLNVNIRFDLELHEESFCQMFKVPRIIFNQ